MDARTLDFYRRNATEVARRYEEVASPIADQFAHIFPCKGRILDIGCGSGRDLALLKEQGYETFGVDAAPELVALAQELHPALKGRIAHGYLPDLSPPFEGQYDGVLCSAVLMHLDASDTAPAAAALRQCLRMGGRLLISVPKERMDLDESNRDPEGRQFTMQSPETLQRVFERADFRLLEQFTNADAMNRRGVCWISQLYEAN